MTLLRIKGQPLLKCHTSLGRYGLIIEFGNVVLDAQLCDGLFPTSKGPNARKYELEYHHLRRRLNAEWYLLLGGREAQLCGTCQAGQESRVDVGPSRTRTTSDFQPREQTSEGNLLIIPMFYRIDARFIQFSLLLPRSERDG